jgi:subtilisin family serine protease
MRRSLFHRIALALAAVVVVAPQFAGPVEATSPTIVQTNPNSSATQQPVSRPTIPPHRFGPIPAADVPAALDARLAGANGPVQVVVELTDEPAAVTYARTQSATNVPSQATSAAKAQLTTIKQKQGALAAALKSLGATEIYRVQQVYDGIAVTIDASQLGAVRNLANVKAVHALIPKKLDLTSSVPLIGAPALWDPGRLNLTGTGIKIGIIDSGIDYEHADFGGFGALTPTVYLSNNTTIVGDVPGFPSAKVVGGYDFVGDAYNADVANSLPVPDPDPSSCLTGGSSADHGTHVAGIAAGYGVTTGGLTYTGPYTSSLDESQFRVGPGVAPGAQLYSLRVFGCNGSTNVVAQAIDWAADPNGDGDFSDHLDVINMSLGSDYGSLYDVDAVASDNAVLAGVIVVASAGNAGNVYDVVGAPSVSGRALSVASSRDAGSVLDGFRVDSGVLSGTVEPAAESAAFNWLTSTLPITGVLIYPPDASGGQRTGCFPFNPTNAAAISGKIVLLDWNDPSCGGSVTRTGNAAAAGAIGVLIADNSVVFDLSITGSSVIPSLSISKQVGDSLKANVPLTMTFDHQYAASVATSDPSIVDTLSSFSSRGVRIRDLALKPDITAPGETIFSAHNGTGNKGINFSGTSMAAPHVTGSMALLREMHPLWSVEELKALAMNTALHDLRSDPELTSTVFSPATSGAGRIDLANTLGTDQVAFNAGQPGLVSVSFGSQEVLTTTTVTRHIRVENQSTSSVTYTVNYSASVTAPGVSFVVSPANLTVPALSAGSVVVTMTAVASAMKRNLDPSVKPTAGGSWMGEASGLVVLDTGVSSPSPLRVPIYVAARPVSAMSAVQSSLSFGTSLVISLTGTGIQTSVPFTVPPNITSLVVSLESQFQDHLGPAGVPYLDQATFKNIGITSDFRAEPNITSTEIFVGISTYGNWSTPIANDTEFDVYFDTNNDGTPDYVMFNNSLPAESDTFVTELINLHTQAVTIEDYLDGVPGDVLDVAPYNNSVMVMPVFASDLGLTPGHSRFTYFIGAAPRELSPNYFDVSPNLSFDAGKPGLDFTSGTPGVPIWGDRPGDSIDVAYPNLVAYQANASQGVLLLHLHNGSGNRDEVLPVNVRTLYLPVVRR